MADDNPRVFLDVTIGGAPAGRLVVELFVSQTPRTVENFRQLCTGAHPGLSYARAPFHRVIDEFMVQGGDVTHGDGTGTASIYGGDYADENLDWRDLDAAGLVCSANRGRDTNGCQFFITLVPCPHLNGKHTVFGRLVSGQDTLARIAKVDVDDDDRPRQPVLISRCGELERKKRRAAPPPSTESAHRGRRRTSDNDTHHSRTPSRENRHLQPPSHPKPRRQSDNIIDEGLRGRARLRSSSRASSTAISDASDADAPAHSSTASVKRKRSPSPSRRNVKHSSADDDRRRRRSLPNQYAREEDRWRPSPRRYGDERRQDRYRPRREYRDEGRLDGGGEGRLGGYADGLEDAPAVTFKGRGVMKYREQGRRW